MEILRSLVPGLKSGLPLLVAVVGIVVAHLIIRAIFARKSTPHSSQSMQQQLIMFALTLLGAIVVVLVAPLNDAQKGQLLNLFGLLVSAAIALSSATFVGNAMAGVMLRVVQSFRMGDFIQIGDHFGRVSERGLFHTEIQTEDRDLMTIPNLHLATRPVKVVRTSGTIVSVHLSLGYDVHHATIEKVLLASALEAGLEDPFVHVVQLQDFSVQYRVAGLLKDVKSLISARARLRRKVLDGLHSADIEIVSPTFMNTRAQPEERVFIPRAEAGPVEPEGAAEARVEDKVFDKAEEASFLEDLKLDHVELTARLAELEKKLKEAESMIVKEQLERSVEHVRARLARLEARLERGVGE